MQHEHSKDKLNGSHNNFVRKVALSSYQTNRLRLDSYAGLSPAWITGIHPVFYSALRRSTCLRTECKGRDDGNETKSRWQYFGIIPNGFDKLEGPR
ncbi:MAG: hypothetical protein M2R45_01703 [Verrucomicrobia subdivision 3 bacterium]|nr:hypothetical protein [Limisphaerales bacterium]MCS1413442.1 hypothetical protein [Limisphaerales bacterium]